MNRLATREGFQDVTPHRLLLALSASLALVVSACSTSLPTARTSATPTTACAGATLHSAAELAAYSHCEAAQGDLRLQNTDLSDLESLSQLRRVSGTLELSGNGELEDLSGLEQLISNNRLLAGRFGLLPQLARVDHKLVLRSNLGLSKRDVRLLLERVERAPESLPLTAQTDAGGAITVR